MTISKNKERVSNIEVLRIIAMLLIILSHYSDHGFGYTGLSYSLNRYFAAWFSGGKIGNDLFFLISGYYMCTQRFNARRLLRIVGEVWFYSVALFTIFAIANWGGGAADTFSALGLEFGTSSIVAVLFPLGSGQTWFITEYVVLMMTSPLLNILLQQLDKKSLQRCLIVVVTFWSVINMFTGIGYDYARLVFVYTLYLCAGYIRLYVDLSSDARRNVLMATVSMGLVFASEAAIIMMGHVIGSASIDAHATHFSGMNSPFVLVATVELLIIALKGRPFSNRYINMAASTTLGVYLMHCNPYLQPYLWKVILGLPESSYGYWWMPLHAVASSIVIFAVCAVIDLIRQATAERAWMSVIDRNMAKFQQIGDSTWDRAYGILERIMM